MPDILVRAKFDGHWEGAYTGTQPTKPGVLLELDFQNTNLRRYAFKPYSRANDGDVPLGPLFIANIDFLTGKTEQSSYSQNDRIFAALLNHGDIVRVRLKSGQSVVAGDILTIESNTGLAIKATGTLAFQPFVALESATGENLVLAIFS